VEVTVAVFWPPTTPEATAVLVAVAATATVTAVSRTVVQAHPVRVTQVATPWITVAVAVVVLVPLVVTESTSIKVVREAMVSPHPSPDRLSTVVAVAAAQGAATHKPLVDLVAVDLVAQRMPVATLPRVVLSTRAAAVEAQPSTEPPLPLAVQESSSSSSSQRTETQPSAQG